MNHSTTWSEKLLILISNYWEHLFKKRPSATKQFFIQGIIALGGFGLAGLIYQETGAYFYAVTLFSAFLIAMHGRVIPGLFYIVTLTLWADYFFIPPLGKVFDSPESIGHFLFACFFGSIMILLVSSLRYAYTILLKAKNDAEQNSLAMEKLLSLVSHDIRNPLSAIKSMAQLVLLHSDQYEEHIKHAHRIIETLDRVDSMILTLLDVTRIRSNQNLTLEFTYCDLHSLLEKTIDNLTLIYRNRLILRGERELWGIWSQSALQRAVENLVSNAVKYGYPHTPVTIKLLQKDHQALISVHNEGEEINREDQAHLFDRYRRSSSAKKNYKEGWGIGLALVKEIATAHQGQILIESSKELGTTFTLSLPILTASHLKVV